MAFSAKDHNLVDKGRVSTYGGSTLDSSHNPSNNMFTYASFFKDIYNQKRTPFEVAPSIVDNGSSPGKALDFTSTFVEATDDFSFIIDCSQFIGMVFKEKTLPSCLRAQYPKGLGIRHRMVGKNHKVIEMNFSTEQDCMEALGKEFVLHGKTIQVSKALDKNANVVRVTVSAISYKPVEFLKPLLIQTFEQYGDILNVGLCHSRDGNWFTGRGFVTLNMDRSKQYEAEVAPQIPFEDFPEKIRLADCPRAKKKVCHKCGNLEHLIAQYPRAHWNRKKDQPTQERRRNSVTKESNPPSKPTGREVNLLELMNVKQPKYLAKKKNTDVAEDAMETDDESTIPEQETQEPADPLHQEAVASVDPVESVEPQTVASPSVAPTTVFDSTLTVESHQDDNLDDKEPAPPDAQETVHFTSEESEYEGGDTSESSVEYTNYGNRYNLSKGKKKSSNAVGDTAQEASQKRSIRELASTPPGSDQEGSAKKAFKQQEDSHMDEAEQGNSSIIKAL
ncbi:L-serine ammonia-lyase [Mucor velutinosus]|uniref:L-serine ammonia-lyase n=1 Tax=Mucor velutinosus TaxID=708070 RepID=A0AAN7HW83_9FUNG|nr:L-serine ammonia-lyase [Mucor velutinosus]